MKAIVNGKLILPQEILTGQTLLFDTRIRRIAPLKKSNFLPARSVLTPKGNTFLPALLTCTSTASAAAIPWTAQKKP